MMTIETPEQHPHLKLIEGDDQQRARKCLDTIMGILESYDCIMRPEVIFGGNQITSRVVVEPKPRDKTIKS